MSECLLIADSGSTKTDWIGVKEGNVAFTIKTDGINPFQMTEEQIAELLRLQLLPELLKTGMAFDSLHFYGAGCRGDKIQMMERILREHLRMGRIEVMSDMMAAARALFGKGGGIACILGTGANSCLYEDGQIVKSISPLGYVLGDEGSGAALGKRLLADALKRQMPDALCEEFFSTYDIKTDEVLQRVYREPLANRYLASFVPFLAQYQANDYVDDLLADEFRRFFVRNILPYDAKMLPVGFVGSIAYVFRLQIERAACELGLCLGDIVKSPAEGLVDYHLR